MTTDASPALTNHRPASARLAALRRASPVLVGSGRPGSRATPPIRTTSSRKRSCAPWRGRRRSVRNWRPWLTHVALNIGRDSAASAPETPVRRHVAAVAGRSRGGRSRRAAERCGRPGRSLRFHGERVVRVPARPRSPHADATRRAPVAGRVRLFRERNGARTRHHGRERSGHPHARAPGDGRVTTRHDRRRTQSRTPTHAERWNSS